MSKWIFLGAICALVACTPVQNSNSAYGNFEADEVTLSPEVSGRIEWFESEEGASVDSGEVLLTIDSIPLVLRRKQLEASAASSKARVQQFVAQQKVLSEQLKSTQKEVARFNQLFEAGAATSKQLDDLLAQERIAKASLSSAEASVATAQSELGVWNAQIESVNDQIDRCSIKAPQSATLLQKYVRHGEMAIPGKPLLKLASLNEMFLRVYLTGDQLSHIQIGQTVKIGFDSSVDRNDWVEGRVTWISPEAEFTPKIIQTKENRVHLVYAAKVLVKNDGRLKMGMPGEIQW